MALLALYSLAYAQPQWAWYKLGFCLALLGESLRLWAIAYSGEPTRGERLEAPRLITAGPYALVRNPLYVGNLLNSLGVVCASFLPWSPGNALVLWGGVVVLYVFLVSYEETFLSRTFGQEYEEYRRCVPAWCPHFRSYSRPYGSFNWSSCWRFERTSLLWWVLVWVALAVKGWWMTYHGS